MTVTATGVARRPVGSDSYWPPVGYAVAWVLSEPVRDIANAVVDYKAYGWRLMGTIGGTDHLQKHGDHTPWSVIGFVVKKRGVIYAVDFGTDDAAELTRFRNWLVAYCRRSDINTAWIDFFNILGRQYDYGGNDVGPSSDHHCHISVNKGYEAWSTDLFQVFTRMTHTPPKPPVVPSIKENEVAVIRLATGAQRWWTDGAYKRLIPNSTVLSDLTDMGLRDVEVAPETLAWLIDVSNNE